MYLADIHTHSIASGHGTSCTISDMAKEAGRKGMKLLGITDHGPGTLASGTSSYFRGLPFCPRKRFGVEVLYGIELNILNVQGHVDLSDELLSNLDYAIISMHSQNYTSGTVKENTLAYQNAMKHPAVKVLGHCDNPAFPVDYHALAYTASRENVIFEINEASLTPGGYRGDTRANNAEILRCCLKYQLPIVKNLCLADGKTKREYAKQLVRQINSENPGAKERMFTAIISQNLDGWQESAFPYKKGKKNE